METAASSDRYFHNRPWRAGVAALGLFGAGIVLGAHAPSAAGIPSRGLIADLAANLPKTREQREAGPVDKQGCNSEAAYWSTRFIYNNLGFPSLVAGFSANAVKWVNRPCLADLSHLRFHRPPLPAQL